MKTIMDPHTIAGWQREDADNYSIARNTRDSDWQKRAATISGWTRFYLFQLIDHIAERAAQ